MIGGLLHLFEQEAAAGHKEGNPIIHLSMLAREGKRIAPGAYGESKVITRS